MQSDTITLELPYKDREILCFKSEEKEKTKVYTLNRQKWVFRRRYNVCLPLLIFVTQKFLNFNSNSTFRTFVMFKEIQSIPYWIFHFFVLRFWWWLMLFVFLELINKLFYILSNSQTTFDPIKWHYVFSFLSGVQMKNDVLVLFWEKNSVKRYFKPQIGSCWNIFKHAICWSTEK